MNDRAPRAETGPISILPDPGGANTRRSRSIDQACQSARVAEDFRGRDTVVLDLTGVTPIFDFFVITTAGSGRQMRAIAEEVDRMLGAQNSRKLSAEGLDTESWILQDYGDIVLHVFSSAARKLYDLEHLWADALPVDWQAHLDRSRTA